MASIDSDEVGPIADPISIPMELAAPSLASWVVESQKAFDAEKESPNPGVDGEPFAANKPQLEADHEADHAPSGLSKTQAGRSQQLGNVSSLSTGSFLPPEDEDPIFHSEQPQSAYPPSVNTINTVNTNNDAPPDTIPAVHKPDEAPISSPQNDAPPDTIPAVRKLDEAPLPSPKKRRLREVHSQPDHALLSAGRTLRSTAKALIDPSNSPSTSAGAEGSTSTETEAPSVKATRSAARGGGGKAAAAAGIGRGRGRQAGASTRSLTALNTASKRGGKGRGKGRGKAT